MAFALLLIPLGLVGWLRRAALRDSTSDPATAWFAYWRAAHGIVLATWLGWAAAFELSGAARATVAAAAPFGAWATFAAVLALFLVPPAVVAILVAAWSHAVSARLRGAGWSLRATVLHAVWQQAGLVTPILCLGLLGPALFLRRPGPAAGCIALAFASRLVFLQLQLRSLDLAPHAVSVGELRDRIFALAARAGVRLRQLYVVPMVRGRIANAFAVRGGVVVLTDHLLAGLGRREIDAVLAHELAHLRRLHPLKLVLAALLPAGLAVILLYRLGPVPTFLAATLLGLLTFFVTSRRFERQADLAAVGLTGDPEALISALGRLNRLNTLPLDWGRWSGSLLTHPSTRRRAQTLARAGGLEPGRVESLLRDGCGDATRYEVPPVLASEGKVFSSLLKARLGLVTLVLTVAALVLAPAALAVLARRFAPAVSRWALLGAASAAALGVWLLLTDRLGPLVLLRLRRRLGARLVRRSIGAEREGGRFVALSPGAAPRVYEGFGDWDVGHLFLRGERCSYLGEETSFALRRDQVLAVRAGEGLPGWLAVPRVLIEWRDDATGAGGVLSVRDAGIARLDAAPHAARRLLADLRAWTSPPFPSTRPEEHPALAALEPPRIGEVTGQTPGEVAAPRLLLPLALLLALAAVGTCALLHLPFAPGQGPGLVDVLGAGFVAAVLQRVPWWWRSARRHPPARAERPAA
jgi:Zn-dependent protease with chaperone function